MPDEADRLAREVVNLAEIVPGNFHLSEGLADKQVLARAVLERGERIKELENDLAKARDSRSIICEYCGFAFKYGGDAATTLGEMKGHTAACPKHPMRALEAERDALKAKVAGLEEIIAGFSSATRLYCRRSACKFRRADSLCQLPRVRMAWVEDELLSSGVDGWWLCDSYMDKAGIEA